MRITENRLRRIIRKIILEVNPRKHKAGINKERQGFESEDAWAKMYSKKKEGIKLRGDFPELKGVFSRAKNIEEPSKEKKKEIFKEIGLEKGVFDDFADAGKSDLQKAKSLYDKRKVKKPENLKQIIRNYNMLIALFRKCDLKTFMALSKSKASSFGTKNYISDSKSLQIVSKPASFSKSEKPKLDYMNVFMKNKNVFFHGDRAPDKKLVIINRVSASTTYIKFQLIEISFNQSESTKSFVEFLKQNNYVRIRSSNIAALKKEALKDSDGKIAYD